MANVRTEGAYLRVEDPIERFDPNEGIVAEDLADAVMCAPWTYDSGQLADFLIAPFDGPRWFSSAAGFEAVRRRIEMIQRELQEEPTDGQQEWKQRQLRALEGALGRLEELRAAGRRFCFVVRDLPAKGTTDPARITPRVVAENLPTTDDLLRELTFVWDQRQVCWRAIVSDAEVPAFAVVVQRPHKYRKKTPPFELLGGLNESLRWLRGNARELNHRVAEVLLPIWLAEFRTPERTATTVEEIEEQLVLARVEWVFDRLILLHFGGELFANSLIRTPVGMNGGLLGEPVIRPDE